MKVRPLLYVTAIFSAILGATVVYLVLSVPNDLRADAMLKSARREMTEGHHDRARQSLAKIVQQYPRTDAAAAATVAMARWRKRSATYLRARSPNYACRTNGRPDSSQPSRRASWR